MRLIASSFVLAASLFLANRSAAGSFDAAQACNALGLRLLKAEVAASPSGNLALSPYSIQAALALAYAGADGATRDGMAKALGFPLDEAAARSGLAALRGALAGDAAGLEWREANRLFGQAGYPFREAFLAELKDGYGAPFEAFDFKTAPEPARAAINGWVERQTQGKIRDLIPMGGITDRTRLVLANALYFKAAWAAPFERGRTAAAPFFVGAKAAVPVPTMHRTESFGYARGGGFAAVALPYQGGLWDLVVILPEAREGAGEAAARLTPEILRALLAGLDHSREDSVSIFLPKFRLPEATLGLRDALLGLGMDSAFDVPRGSADFSRAAPKTPSGYLALSEVFHQAFVDVDEEGTEAAAATATVMLHSFAVAEQPVPPVEVRFDHPFLFALRHVPTGACVFLGAVSDPR